MAVASPSSQERVTIETIGFIHVYLYPCGPKAPLNHHQWWRNLPNIKAKPIIIKTVGQVYCQIDPDIVSVVTSKAMMPTAIAINPITNT
jgi:hypothetical protein